MSSADSGSSSTITFGANASARAMTMRWRWPPESSCGQRSRCSGARPTSSTSSRMRASRSAPAARPCTSNGTSSVWRMRLRGFSEANGSWNTICTSRVSRRRSASSSVARSRPSTSSRPDVGGYSPTIARPSVVLPQPDSPTTPSTSPARTSRLTPSTARSRAISRLNGPPRTGNSTDRASAWSSGGVIGKPPTRGLRCERLRAAGRRS